MLGRKKRQKKKRTEGTERMRIKKRDEGKTRQLAQKRTRKQKTIRWGGCDERKTVK